MAVTNPKFNPSGSDVVAKIKTLAGTLGEAIEALPDGRRKSIALTKLEDATMWAVKAAVVGDKE